MEVTRDDVEKVAQLARLRMVEQELSTFAEQLSSILTYVDQLKAISTDEVSAASAAPGRGAASSREDVVRASLPLEAALGNAPDADEGAFRVPKVIGGK
ncbi:MAG: Asp-tRNA(Asn)/Glu-tRNA(Gln) amidotransferase subunit GatC [Nitrospiraceae bacterium]